MSSVKSISVSTDPKGLVIAWDDGHQGTYSFSFLRKACPCALCKGERTPLSTEPLALPVLTHLPAEAFEGKNMFKVGHYALGFEWGDGHNTGIYTFDYLRQICPCQECL